MFHTFAFCCLSCCCLVGVFAGTDAVKSVSVSVMEGDSVSLNSDLTEIQKDEEIMWKFGTNGPLIAKTDGVKHTIPDNLDGRFRDRLKLDKKTGSLTIMNIRTEDAGVYEVEISNSRSETKHRFTVTVYGPDVPDKELYERGMEKESDTTLTSLTRRTAAAAEATPISAVTTNRSTASTESRQGAWPSEKKQLSNDKTE